jgi:dihydrofolate reductase
MGNVRTRCSVFIATSLDGFIARLDGGIDWLSIVERPGEDYGYRAFFDTIDAVVVGRSTWEVARGFSPWPYEGKRVVVFTRRALDAAHGEEAHAGTPDELVDRLSREGLQRAYVDGGAVIRQFLAAGLVDDLTISVVPIVLGGGLPLFDAIGRELRLDLVQSRAFESGLVRSEYGVRR